MIYLELRDSCYDFKGAVVIQKSELSSSELIENFKSSLEENNWLEDKSFDNVIEIFLNFACSIDEVDIDKGSICLYNNKYFPNIEIKKLIENSRIFTEESRNITVILDKYKASYYKKQADIVDSEDDNYETMLDE